MLSLVTVFAAGIALILAGLVVIRLVVGDVHERAGGPVLLVTLVPLLLLAVIAPLLCNVLEKAPLRWLGLAGLSVGLGLLSMVVTVGTMSLLFRETVAKMGPGAMVYLAPALLFAGTLVLSFVAMLIRQWF